MHGVSSLLVMPMPFLKLGSPQPPPPPSAMSPPPRKLCRRGGAGNGRGACNTAGASPFLFCSRAAVLRLDAAKVDAPDPGTPRSPLRAFASSQRTAPIHPHPTPQSPARHPTSEHSSPSPTQYRAMPMQRNDGGRRRRGDAHGGCRASCTQIRARRASADAQSSIATSVSAALILAPAPTTDEGMPRTHNEPRMFVVSALLRSVERCADRDDKERGVDGANEASAARRIAPTPRARAVNGGQHVRAGALREGVREARPKPAQRESKATKYITCSIINLIDFSSDS
ncbi:hypothetical protein DFH09DRAFT_1189190 [Mycena vulgaris]|nr:hypothetical protein DFH09DRAFT_1189190 [Mycena vulgaris]